MPNNLLLALEITALGMGLVFAAIILLWWMMNLLTALTADKASSSVTTDSTASPIEEELKAQAAAAAVAFALAEQQASLAHPLLEPPTAIVSAWQLGTRTRQLYEKGTPILRKPRKIG
jgi:Na+-transporting methylmalonyl-CoA/oxaloacetate decarboxylase gamma subunit